jgi:hypothetical protein
LYLGILAILSHDCADTGAPRYRLTASLQVRGLIGSSKRRDGSENQYLAVLVYNHERLLSVKPRKLLDAPHEVPYSLLNDDMGSGFLVYECQTKADCVLHSARWVNIDKASFCILQSLYQKDYPQSLGKFLLRNHIELISNTDQCCYQTPGSHTFRVRSIPPICDI